MAVPQHTGKKTLAAVPEDFGEKILQFGHLPWIRTAMLPDPRDRLLGPADPAITRRQVPEDAMPLFSGDCFGNESCSVDSRLRPSIAELGGPLLKQEESVMGP